MPTAQQRAAEEVVAAVRKAFGRESALVLGAGGSLAAVEMVVPTGLPVLDRWVLPGGLPVGRMVELFGGEGAGKSSLVASALAATQKMGGIAIVADTEYSLSPERVALFGVDLDSLVLLQPGHLSELFAQAQAAITAAHAITKGKRPILFAWDSIAMTPSAHEVEEGLGGTAVPGERARAMSLNCPILARVAAETNTCLLFVNQIRMKIGVMYGNPETTPGGHAVKHFSSVRLQIRRGKAIKEGKADHIGMYVSVTSLKNKHVPPFRKCRAELVYATGWANAWSVLDHAKDRAVVPPATKLDALSLGKAIQALGWDDGPTPLDPAALLAQEYVPSATAVLEDEGEEE